MEQIALLAVYCEPQIVIGQYFMNERTIIRNQFPGRNRAPGPTRVRTFSYNPGKMRPLPRKDSVPSHKDQLLLGLIPIFMKRVFSESLSFSIPRLQFLYFDYVSFTYNFSFLYIFILSLLYTVSLFLQECFSNKNRAVYFEKPLSQMQIRGYLYHFCNTNLIGFSSSEQLNSTISLSVPKLFNLRK